jgi:hypothetical protein
MSIRKINTTISTIRGLYDEKGNYLPSGNYYFEIKDYNENGFSGKLPNFGNFCFSPRKLVKMMAVGQSRLATSANLMEDGMPNYPFPSSNNRNLSRYVVEQPFFHRTNRNIVIPQEQHECSICLDKITNNNKKVLTCSHIFHRDCVNTWLQESANCPLCRTPQRRVIENDITIEDLDNYDNPRIFRYTNRRYREFNRRGNRTIVFPSRFSRK